MAGDLEDFLRRAAERRAQKQAGGGGGQRQGQPQRPAPQKPKPQYTEARRERQIRQPVEEAIPVAEIVEPVNPLADQERRLAESKRKAEEARRKLAAAHEQDQSRSPAASSISLDGTPAEQLLQLIRGPGGIQQAFLLREILERPMDRWD